MQLQIDFEGTILDQHPVFMDCVRASVYGSRRAFKAIAADLDMSVSELSRKLADNPNDPVHFPVDRLPELIVASGDPLPIYWLIAKLLRDPDEQFASDMQKLARMIPEIEATLNRLGVKSVKAVHS